ncbi:MAG: transporter substrate-binding domain-containing protein [Christensenella sp.]|nr:transporter substrate-binding domain-containing protein [Christensenella sp.]
MKKTLLAVIAILIIVATCFCVVACSSSKKVSIGVQGGTTGEYYVKGDPDWGFDGFPNVTYKPFQNAGLAVTDMKAGNLKAVVIDEAPAKALAKKISGIKVIDIALTEEEYAFGVDKAQPELKSSINSILASDEFKAAYDQIVAKYFSDEEIEGIVAATKADADKAAGQLVVATNAEFAPFEYKIGDKFAGIDMEIAKYIADALDLELVVLDMDFDAVVSSVGKNNIDVAMAGLTVNEKRKESVDFTNSYYNAAQMVVVLSDDTTFDSCKTKADVEEVLKAL